MTTTVHYKRSTHAALFKRFMDRERGFVAPGVEKSDVDSLRIDPETGAEYRALGGDDHCYSRDHKVGGSYPKCTFVYANDGEGDSLTHDELEELLKANSLWSDALTPVILPKAYEYGEVTWWSAFQFKPVERSPRMDRVATQLENRGVDPNLIYQNHAIVEAPLEA